MLKIIKELPVSPNSSLNEKLPHMAPLYKKHNVHWLCEAMNVDRGTFYNYIFRNKKDNTWYDKRRENLKEEIQKIYNESQQIYGVTKITQTLKQKGIRTSEKLVGALMHDMGLKSIRHRAKLFYEKEIKLKNIVKQEFNPNKPNEIWVSDVTYFKTKFGAYYICVIIDLFSRMVISYNIGVNNSTHLTKKTFLSAYKSRQPSSNIIFHTDRGANYASKTFSKCLSQYNNITQSFSKPATPYENSVVESFFSSLKREELYRRIYTSDKDFRKNVDAYISFYNTKRIHSNNNYKTPEQKELDFYKQNSF